MRKLYTSEAADKMFAPFEDWEMMNEIHAAASRLAGLVWSECAPSFLQPENAMRFDQTSADLSKLDPSGNDPTRIDRSTDQPNGKVANESIADSSASPMDRTPCPLFVFAILHATSKAVETTRRIREDEDEEREDSNGALMNWRELGCWVWRLNQLFDSIADDGVIPLTGWSDDVTSALLDHCEKFDDAFNDAHSIATVLGGDLDDILDHCEGKKGTFPEAHLATVLRPFQRTFKPALNDRDETLATLTRNAWDEWMPGPGETDPDGERLLEKLLNGSLLAEMKRDDESALNGRDPEALAELPNLEPSENGTAAPNGQATATMPATNGRTPEAPAELPMDATSETPHPGPPVELNGPDEEVIVCGIAVGRLPDAEYRVIRVLLDAYTKGERLSEATLRNRTKDAQGNKVEDPVGALKRLRKKKNTPWPHAIEMSGRTRRGYTLKPRPDKPPDKPPTKTR